MDSAKTTRCTDCRSEFTDAEIEGANACPSCGSKGVPMSISQDVTIRINWHELRILTIWSENWARHIAKDGGDQHWKALRSILRELDAQRPEGFPALTLADEVGELRKEHPGANLYDSKGTPLLPEDDDG